MIFGWEQREENNKKRKQIRYLNIFNIINILQCWVIITISRCYVVPDSPIWLMDNFLYVYMYLQSVKRSVICKFQCFCLFDIQQRPVLF